jgi:hypothetical protein
VAQVRDPRKRNSAVGGAQRFDRRCHGRETEVRHGMMLDAAIVMEPKLDSPCVASELHSTALCHCA